MSYERWPPSLHACIPRRGCAGSHGWAFRVGQRPLAATPPHHHNWCSCYQSAPMGDTVTARGSRSSGSTYYGDGDANFQPGHKGDALPRPLCQGGGDDVGAGADEGCVASKARPKVERPRQGLQSIRQASSG